MTLINTWQPIETAPKDGTSVLLLFGAGLIEGCWSNKDNMWEVVWLNQHGCGCCSSPDPDPTHWTRLPEPPIESN